MQTVDNEPIEIDMIVYDGYDFYKVVNPYDDDRCVVIHQSGFVTVLSTQKMYSCPESFYDMYLEKLERQYEQHKEQERKRMETYQFHPTHTIYSELYQYVPNKCDAHDRANTPLSVTSKNRKCRVCGCEFNGREGAKYCSSKCRKQASRLGI
jgi:hypothetical protein